MRVQNVREKERGERRSEGDGKEVGDVKEWREERRTIHELT